MAPGLARVVFVAVGLACVAAAWMSGRWFVANTVATRLDLDRPESRLVAEWLTRTAPSDPQTHFAAGKLYEKTFSADDLARSLVENELAASLSPNDYRLWLNVARSRAAGGDNEAADAAYQRALTLAPNYGETQWAYGNFLVREGRLDEGFALIARSAEDNWQFARVAALNAMQIFDGDLGAVTRAVGEGEAISTALVAVLASEKRFDDAVEIWLRARGLAAGLNSKTTGEKLVDQLVAGGRFRLAARVVGEIEGPGGPAIVGKIQNGGFESEVKLRNAGPFEWRIEGGAHPQIGLTDGQKRSGAFSLFLLFNTFETAAFRTISQIVVVEPGRDYEFETFYRADLQTAASFNWEILDAVSHRTIAVTPPLALAGDWTTLRAQFRVPDGVDGVLIRLGRQGCSGPSCPVMGRLSFDDFSLRSL